MKTVSQVRKAISLKRTRIAILRSEAGIGTRELATFVDISASTISRIESGKAPDIRSALHLAKFFETSVEDLFNEFF